MLPPGPPALRRAALAVSVVHDVDLVPDAPGLVLPGTPEVLVGWEECQQALDGEDPESAVGRLRLLHLLQARRWAADLSAPALRAALCPAGLPVGHALHPGPAWVRERVLGGALDLGLAAVGLDPDDPERAVLLPPAALAQAGLDPVETWAAARRRLEELGGLAAERLARDPKGLLRPYGPCDVVTLLGSRTLRAAVAGASGGLGSAVVPMLRRGWTRLALVDPAFAPAAAAATSAQERGFARPLLVTADEVAVVREGGRAAALALRDDAAPDRCVRDVTYR